MISASTGQEICSLKNLVLRRHVSLRIQAPLKSYDLVFQPVELAVFIPPLERTFARPDQSTTAHLYRVLDSVALQIIKDSLDKAPAVGKEVWSIFNCRNIALMVLHPQLDRHRYHELCKKALQTRKNVPLSMDEVEGARKCWPAYFSVTERIELVHTSIYESSSVCDFSL